MQFMQYVEVENQGARAKLTMAACVRPSCGPDEVLIRVRYAGVNRADLYQKKGHYSPPPGGSSVLGLEVSGVVEAVGRNVTCYAVADEVCALLEGGGYAQYVVVAATQVLPVPQGMTLEQAGALPEAVFTVWRNLFDIVDIRKCQNVLIHGGASGIGTMAIQLARVFGIVCYTTAGHDKKCERLSELGADRAINYHREDFVAVCLEQTQNRGVDVILDIVGGTYFQKNMKALAYGGSLVSIAFFEAACAQVNFAPLLMKNLTIKGSTLRHQPSSVKMHYRDVIQSMIWPLFADKKIQPVIDSIFPVTEAEEAHIRMENREHIGKILLKF